MEEVVPGALAAPPGRRLGDHHVVNAELAGVTPTPLREIVAGEFVALLSTDTTAGYATGSGWRKCDSAAMDCWASEPWPT